MIKRMFPDRGAKAFPDGCPCCGKVLFAHNPEESNFDESWVFDCGCEISLGGGVIPFAEYPCPTPIDDALEDLVVTRGAAE